jgi:HAD superfamily hydrolase (TIGR01549 family)
VVDHAIIFDVDGVLLDLTHAEEELFFTALSKYVPTQHLSRDWNSYKIRNDEDIIAEILEHHAMPENLKQEVIDHYIEVLRSATLQPTVIAGAYELLQACTAHYRLGIATANLRAAAALRLQRVGLWQPVQNFAFGADGGGHKTDILGRALEALQLPRSHVIYIGDNLNDVAAGLHHGVRFIGFAADEKQRWRLQQAGAQHVCGNHLETMALISTLLT